MKRKYKWIKRHNITNSFIIHYTYHHIRPNKRTLIDSPESTDHDLWQNKLKDINSKIIMALYQTQLSRDRGALTKVNILYTNVHS